MASTYSPSLRLELMATGDQSGTWGDTTNTNLGTLLEQSITGYLSKAMADTDQTLTNLNGASDEARNMVVEATGALTAGRNMVVPTAEKLYLIKNSTTGGFAVTVKTSAGTGVAVPMGGAVWVYCDGTNVVSGNNYTEGLTSGAVFTDAGATVGPVYDLFRDSSSPAASDILGRVAFNGRDSAANKQEYGSIEAVITDPTSTSEDSALDFYVQVAGARTKLLSVGPTATATRTSLGAIGTVVQQVFESSGTYTPTSGMLYCIIECVGGGGGSGGATAAAGKSCGSGGGGGGGYSRHRATAAQIGASQTVTIGAAGAAGTASTAGGAGGDTSVGAIVVGKGGQGSSAALNGVATSGAAGGTLGSGQFGTVGSGGHAGTGGEIVTIGVTSGHGGDGPFGGGGTGLYRFATGAVAGTAGGRFGAGAGGALEYNGATGAAGAAGSAGVVIVTEYCA